MRSLLFIVLLMSLKINGHGEGSCPNVCNCKWKGGKETVECRGLKLNSLPEEISPTTQVLDMSGNPLHSLPREIFLNSELVHLQKLFLKTCHLKKVEDSAFAGLSNLIELDMSHNYLTIVPSNSLAEIPSLRDLFLADNPIIRIDDNAFRSVPHLNKLDLSDCHLAQLSRNAFKGLDLLHLLKINGNKLTEMHEQTIRTLSGLHGIEMHDNPWWCDCRMRISKLWLAENKVSCTVSPVCSSPDTLQGRKFIDLHVDDFACKPQMLPVRRNIKVEANENATIVCKTNAVPAAKIKWYWNGKLVESSTANLHARATISGGGAISATAAASSQPQSSSSPIYKRIYIFEDGNFHKQSHFVLINAQVLDSNELYCVAENRAGTIEMNFTLQVTLSSVGLTTFGNNQIASVSAVLVIVLLVMIVVIFTLIFRIRHDTTSAESKIPRDGGDHDSENKLEPILPKKLDEECESKQQNGSICTSPLVVSPTDSNDNNPDLINDTRQLSNPDLSNLDTAPKIVNYINKYCSIDKPPPLNEWSAAAMSTTTTQPLNEPIYHNQSTLVLPSYISSSPSSSQSTTATTIIQQASPLHDDETGTELVDRSQIFNHPDYMSKIFFERTVLDRFTGGHDAEDAAGASSSPAKNRGHTLPNYVVPSNAKTLRVWQSGGVSVLPPLTAMKRILTTANRNSPDEGYQEGCSTDV